MKKDLIRVIRDMSKFLGYHLTELKILTLDDHLYIDNLRKNHAASMPAKKNETLNKVATNFFRKGIVGDWKTYFAGDNLKLWDEWIKKNTEGTDLNITFI